MNRTSNFEFLNCFVLRFIIHNTLCLYSVIYNIEMIFQAPITSPSATAQKQSPWWTNKTLVISLIAWLLGVTIAIAIACTLISWRFILFFPLK